MKIDGMSFIDILNNFRARDVVFKFKDGTERTIFVNEIENEEDDQLGTIFMADDPEDDVWLSDVVSAKALN